MLFSTLLTVSGFGRKSPENDREKNFLLGICFLQGIMVEKDTQRALSLLESAAEDGHVNACKQLRASK